MNFEEFSKNKNQFTLGHLTTESFHSKTLSLSIQSKENLPLAIQTLKKVDIDAFNLLLKLESEIYKTYKKLKS